MISSEDHQRYIKLKDKHTLPLKIEDQIDYMERIIREEKVEKGGFLACYTAKKNTVDPEFVRAFSTLNKEEQYSLFRLYVETLQKHFAQQPLKQQDGNREKSLFSVQIREGTLRKSWTAHRVEIDPQTLRVGMAGSNRYDMDLHEYLVRKSKATDKVCFVMESAKKNINRTLRIGFDTRGEFDRCYNVVSALVRKAQIQNIEHFLKIYEELKGSNAEHDRTKGGRQSGFLGSSSQEKNALLNNPRQMESQQVVENNGAVEKTIADELVGEGEEQIDIIDRIVKEDDLVEKVRESEVMKSPLRQQEITKVQAVERKRCLDIFHKMMPEYELDELSDESNYRIIKSMGKFRILNSSQPHLYKIFGTVSFSVQEVLAAILDCHRYKLWNEEVELADTKIRITSENSAIVYQKHKPYSKFYKARDFLFLRHVFSQDDHYYIIDKSIENSHYPPFSNIIRGNMKYCLWGLSAKGEETMMSLACEILHEGFLTGEQHEALTIRYLTAISNIEQFLRQSSRATLKIDKCFDLTWDIARNVMNQSQRQRRNSKTVSIQNEHSLSHFGDDLSQIDSERFYTAHGLEEEKWDGVSMVNFQDEGKNSAQSDQEVKEILEPSIQDPNIDKVVGCELNAEGYAILPKTYLTKKHRFTAVESDYKPIHNPDFPHQIWRDEWKPVAEVGLFYIHMKKIEVQKGILKYVISKLGKNLLSGKGILNISLPVDIFGTESNLERTARLMSFGPMFMEKACATKDQVERFKFAYCYALGLGLMGLEMDKPFNPILGETYQGWMNGCPIFLEQISHHPPIAAFLMQGRGYKIYGNIESRMEISINSGCGINYGEHIIEFEDTKQKIRIRTPGGEVSGLTFGDRVFNFVGRTTIYDYQNDIFSELIYNPTKKGFFSLGKQEKEADYVSGRIMKVRPQFLQSYRNSESKKETPQPKHLIDVLSNITGRWTLNLEFDGVEYMNVDRDLPCILQQEKYPLNSNSHYREDLIYLKKRDLARSQLEKERLENVQRADRKLRQKYHKKHH